MNKVSKFLELDAVADAMLYGTFLFLIALVLSLLLDRYYKPKPPENKKDKK